MIADMHSNKYFNKMVTVNYLLVGRKLNIYLVFIMQSCFKVLKYVKLSTVHFLL